MTWYDWVSTLCLCIGVFLCLTGAVGILRMPGFYARLHPAGKSDSLGQFLVLIALMFQAYATEDGLNEFSTDPRLTLIKLILIFLVVMITGPTATHAITKAAFMDGLKPWTKESTAEVDEHRSEFDKAHDSARLVVQQKSSHAGKGGTEC